MLTGCDNYNENNSNTISTTKRTISYEPKLRSVNEIEYFYKVNPNTSHSICDFNQIEGQKDLHKNLTQGEFEKTVDFQERVAKMKDQFGSKWTGIIRHKYTTSGQRSREDGIKYNPDTEITTININPRFVDNWIHWYQSNDYVIKHDSCGYSSDGYYGSGKYGMGEWFLAIDVDLSRLGLSNYSEKITDFTVPDFTLEKKYSVEDVKKLKYEEVYNEFITYLGFENISNINKEPFCFYPPTTQDQLSQLITNQDQLSQFITNQDQLPQPKQCFSAIETSADIAYFFVFSTKLNEFIHTYMSKNYADEGLLNDINFARFVFNKDSIFQEDYSEQDLIRMYIELWDDGYRTSKRTLIPKSLNDLQKQK